MSNYLFFKNENNRVTIKTEIEMTNPAKKYSFTSYLHNIDMYVKMYYNANMDRTKKTFLSGWKFLRQNKLRDNRAIQSAIMLADKRIRKCMKGELFQSNPQLAIKKLMFEDVELRYYFEDYRLSPNSNDIQVGGFGEMAVPKGAMDDIFIFHPFTAGHIVVKNGKYILSLYK